MVRKGEEKRAMSSCRARGDTREQEEAPWYLSKRKHRLALALQTTDMTPKTQPLGEAHPLTVCGGETEQEMLAAVGKWCTLPSSPPTLLLPSVSKAEQIFHRSLSTLCL